MSATAQLVEIASSVTNPFMNQWKDQGGKVVGYTCTYIPEEILLAAGLMPYRLKGIGAAGTTRADVFLPKFHCSFSRTLFDQALSGAFDFLDGVVFSTACDQLRRMYDVWKRKISFNLQPIIVIPHSLEEEDFEWFLTNEVNRLVGELERHLGVELTAEALVDAVEVYNQTRQLLSRLYEARVAAEPRVTGVEAHRLVIAATSMPKADYNRLLAQALDEIAERDPLPTQQIRARIMVGGSMIDSPELLEVIEDVGGLVVTDILCTGSRWFTDPVRLNGNGGGDGTVAGIVRAIAHRYYHHAPCPRLVMAYDKKWEHARRQAEMGKVDGAVLSLITFCDHHSADNVLIKDDLEATGVPTLILNREYAMSDMGRFKTRVEAFLEKLGR
jgi:bzd-type benzoyl-CoA reductase N subunit